MASTTERGRSGTRDSVGGGTGAVARIVNVTAAGSTSASTSVKSAASPMSVTVAPSSTAPVTASTCTPSATHTAGWKRTLPGCTRLPTSHCAPVTASGGNASNSTIAGAAASTRSGDSEPTHALSASVAGTATTAAPAPVPSSSAIHLTGSATIIPAAGRSGSSRADSGAAREDIGTIHSTRARARAIARASTRKGNMGQCHIIDMPCPRPPPGGLFAVLRFVPAWNPLRVRVPDSKHILQQRWPPLGRLGLFALVYGASITLGIRLVGPSDELISTLWPPSGVLLSALLLSRFRDWPALLLVAIVLGPFIAVPGRMPHMVGFLISTTSALEALAGAFLLRRHAGFRPSLERVRDVLALVGLAALLSTVLGATPGVTLLALQGIIPWADWGSRWRVFWVGDAMGVLLVAPVLLSWCARGLEGWSRARRLELAVLLGALVLAVDLVFHWEPAATSLYHPISYLAFPFILWAALRFEVRGTAAAMLALATVALLHTLEGNGPFAPGPELNVSTERLVFLQSFLAAVGGSGLLLAAALGERRRAQEKATHLNRELRQSLHALASAQQELVRRERMAALGELSASVAHEVRNPLAVIANSVAALTRLATPAENATVWELLGVMDEEVARLDHLINGLLEFARPQEPRLLPQPLGPVVDEALESALRSAPHAERVRVTRELEPALPDAPVDALLLHLALSNLFTNALQAMPQGGTLRVLLGHGQTRGGTPQALISITDSGPGIAPEAMARLFEPFYTTKASGTGLGLAIVRSIIESHHGQVEARTTQGQGTTFIVHLPLAEASRPSAAA